MGRRRSGRDSEREGGYSRGASKENRHCGVVVEVGSGGGVMSPV